MEIAVNDEIGYWAEEISKKNIEGVIEILLIACSKMQEERDNWRGTIKEKGTKT